MMKQKINYITELFIGIFIICFIIWNRFFRNRIGYNLDVIIEVSFFKVITTLLLTSFFIYLLVISLLNLMGLEFISNFKYFSNLKEKIFSYTTHTLELVFRILFYEIPAKYFPSKWKTGELTHKIAYNLYIKFYINEHKIRNIHFIFNILPKILVSSSFCYSVFIEQNLSFFFCMLIILSIPLIFNIIKYSLQHFTETNLKILEEFVEINEITNGEYYIKPKVEFTSQEEFEEYATAWGELNSVRKLFYLYENIIQEYVLKYYILIYFLYSSGWTYLLFIFTSKFISQ